MKFLIAIALCLLFLASVGQTHKVLYGALRDSKTQTKVDVCEIRVTYKYIYIIDTSKKERAFDFMALEIGETINKFYSTSTVRSDSIYTEFLKTPNSKKENAEPDALKLMLRNQRMEYKDIYFNYPTKGIIQTTRRVIDVNYFCNEKFCYPVWNILQETKSIHGYQCQKATTKYCGRNWEVWFTDEVPLNFGPWKLGGLPGLILSAVTDDNYFEFEIVGIEQPKNAFIYHYNDKFNKLSVSEMKKMEVKLYEDPVGVMVSLGKQFAVIENGKLTVLKAGDIHNPYIPSLELE